MKPIQRDLLYTKIADAIMEYIKKNDLKTGDKIPSERVLAQEFNTSRNSVREALRVLEKDHVIEVKMGKGAYITEEKTGDSFFLQVWKVNYIELLEVKSILEMQIIRSLCGNMTQSQIDSLNEPLTRMENGMQMGFYLQQEDFIFHSRMRKIYGNSTMEQMLDNLIKALDDYGKNLVGEEKLWRETVPYHRDILNAMIENKPFAAQVAYEKIWQIDKQVLELFEEIQENTNAEYTMTENGCGSPAQR